MAVRERPSLLILSDQRFEGLALHTRAASKHQNSQWWKNEPNIFPNAPNSPLVAGVGAAPGAAAPPGGGIAAPGPATKVGDGARPPCNGQICVGAVPFKNGTVTIRGHPEVARPPLCGSIVAIVIPGGTANGDELRGVTSSIKFTHPGNAAVAPEAPRL